MKILGFLFWISYSLISVAHAAPSPECDAFMASIVKAGDSTATYVALVRNLAVEKSAFTAESLNRMLSETGVANPLAYLSREITPGERFAFSRGFDSLRDVNWNEVKEELLLVAEDLHSKSLKKIEAQSQTAPVHVAIPFGILPLSKTFSPSASSLSIVRLRYLQLWLIKNNLPWIYKRRKYTNVELLALTAKHT